MAQFVFILMTLTALACALLLLRAHARTKTRLLLVSGICFAGLSLANAMVFVDLIVVPQVSLIWLRSAIVIGSLLVLIVGLVWDVPFLLEGGSHGALALEANPLEARPVFYLPRLLAYLLIIAGIVLKNVKPKPPAG